MLNQVIVLFPCIICSALYDRLTLLYLYLTLEEGRQDTGQLSLPAIFRQFSHDGGQRRHALERSVLQLGWDQHQIRGPNCSFLDRTP